MAVRQISGPVASFSYPAQALPCFGAQPQISVGQPQVRITRSASGCITPPAPAYVLPQFGAPQISHVPPVVPQAVYASAQPQVSYVAPISASSFGGSSTGGSMQLPMASSGSNLPHLMSDRQQLKKDVVKCFKAVAGGRKNIDIHALRQFMPLLAQRLNLPNAAFGDIEQTQQRFDFNGNGQFEVNEVYKLVKFSLYDYMKQIGARPEVDIPHKSLASAGLRVTRELGSGSQATAMLATDTMGRERCVKVYRKGQMQVGGIAELKDEFEAMKLVACKNVAQIDEIFQDASSYYMVGDVMHGGDFVTLVMRARQAGANTDEAWHRNLFRQCFEALLFMHEQALMHCDIKEPNLMLKTPDYHNPHVVLIDFGVSTAMAKKDTGLAGGTPGYIPPETYELGKWFPGGDVFSMGVVMTQLVLGMVPNEKIGQPMIGIFLQGCTTFDMVRTATLTRPAPTHQIQYPGLGQLCAKCLTKQLQGRPKAPQVLRDPWFSGTSFAPSSSPAVVTTMPSPTVVTTMPATYVAPPVNMVYR